MIPNPELSPRLEKFPTVTGLRVTSVELARISPWRGLRGEALRILDGLTWVQRNIPYLEGQGT